MTDQHRLAVYACADGTETLIYNARPAPAPHMALLPDGRLAVEVEGTAHYTPQHRPAVGDLVFVDQDWRQALEWTRRAVDEQWDHPRWPLSEELPGLDPEEVAQMLTADRFRNGPPAEVVEVTNALLARMEGAVVSA